MHVFPRPMYDGIVLGGLTTIHGWQGGPQARRRWTVGAFLGNVMFDARGLKSLSPWIRFNIRNPRTMRIDVLVATGHATRRLDLPHHGIKLPINPRFRVSIRPRGGIGFNTRQNCSYCLLVYLRLRRFKGINSDLPQRLF